MRQAVVLLIIGGSIGWAVAQSQVVPEQPSSKPSIIAHRAGILRWPENTIYGIEQSIIYQVDGVELDVQLSSDGHAVIIHDETVDRTTDGTGRVAALTLEELQQLDAGYHFTSKAGEYSFRGQGHTIPTLEEVLAFASQTRLILDLKAVSEPVIAQLCQEIVDQELTTNVWLLSEDATMHHQLQIWCQQPDVVWNIEQQDHIDTRNAHASSESFIRIGNGQVTGAALVDLITRSHTQNIHVLIGPVDSSQQAVYLSTLGVDSIIVSQPSLD